MSVQILIGDVREKLATLPDNSIDCVVTSPPYWGLRDYGVEGQLGMERSLGEHLDVMAEVFEDVRRVLKPTGTLWLNYGDCYATKPNGRSALATKEVGNDDRTFRDKPFSTVGPVYEPEYAKTVRGKFTAGDRMTKVEKAGRVMAGGFLKPKYLCGVPWRVAFALQDRGWWLRQDIIWSKPNPMPESIKDRCTKAHEYLFLMAKSERYYFDQDAIMEGLAEASVVRLAQDVESQQGSDRVPGKTNGRMKAVSRKRGVPPRHAQYPDSSDQSGLDQVGRGMGRNRRSVWTVPTMPFSEAHFATFPPDLIVPCILAGCPEGGTVLDPFFGAGTTGLVADRLGRNCIGIELNPEYAEMARRRIWDDAGLFAQVAAA